MPRLLEVGEEVVEGLAVVTVKAKATGAVGASEEAPAGGGGWKWAAPNGQASGTLLYTDGAGTTYRWKMPRTDSGPQVTELEEDLAD
ncbi:hypothetical protein [Streptomyces reniochalinae]|uniref:Uncharacterized protein n=1 Tax=Streptomyces reniochalinae TaxID=2250578 RepID=A0A367EG19_9ACTN|nr:hypothetical protein [Streptomyces reniochalinae]RCG16699.1 hypothetical protein DQ392_21605 [Streptomyces reniochalinae]